MARAANATLEESYTEARFNATSETATHLKILQQLDCLTDYYKTVLSSESGRSGDGTRGD